MLKGLKDPQKQLSEAEKGKKGANWKQTGYFIHLEEFGDTQTTTWCLLNPLLKF